MLRKPQKCSWLILHEKGVGGGGGVITGKSLRYMTRGREAIFLREFHESARTRVSTGKIVASRRKKRKYYSAIDASDRPRCRSALCFRITSRWEEIRRRWFAAPQQGEGEGGGGHIRNDRIIKVQNPDDENVNFRFTRTFGTRLGSSETRFRSRTRFIFHSACSFAIN